MLFYETDKVLIQIQNNIRIKYYKYIMIKLTKILLLLSFILLIATQGGGGGGGGGGGRSRSRSSSRRSSSVYIPPKSGCGSNDCPRLKNDCDLKCQQDFSQEIQKNSCLSECKVQYGTHQKTNWVIPVGIFGGFVAVVILCQKNKKKEDVEFIAQHNQDIKQFQYSQDQLDQRFRSLKVPKSSIHFYQGTNFFSTAEFRIQGSKGVNKCLYKINFSSSDSFGAWTASGHISFSKNGTSIWFSKVYRNRQAAGQTGRWWSLIYQGKLNESTNLFSGNWYYKGFQNDPLYSGRWQMNNLKHD